MIDRQSDRSIPGLRLEYSLGILKVRRLGTGDLVSIFPDSFQVYEDELDHEPWSGCGRNWVLSADGKLLLRGCKDNVQIWEGDGNYRKLKSVNASSSPVLSADCHLLAASAWVKAKNWPPSPVVWLGRASPPDDRPVLKLYDLANGSELGAFTRGTEACFSPDGSTLAVLTKDQTVELYDLPLHRPWWRALGAGVLVAITLFLGDCLLRRLLRRSTERPVG
jgi:WD40 repeat protein